MYSDAPLRGITTSGPTWPIAIEAYGPVSCGALLWKLGRRTRATIMIAATFEIDPGGPMKPVLAEPLAITDVPHASGTSTYIATDLVPFRKLADVVLTGYACAPACAETRAVAAKLAVFRDKPLLDKTIHVFGDERGTKLFQKMPLIYERAYGGPGIGENPVGTGAMAGSPSPNLIHPTTPTRVACFGPLRQDWPVRAHYVEGLDPEALAGPQLVLPASFDMDYFHSAPADQRIDFLHGDEWIVLDAMTPSMPRSFSQLPLAHAQARVWGHPELRDGQPLDLVADTLRIDADRLLCTVVWRAGFPLAYEESRWRLRVIAGVESKEIRLEWPDAWKIAEREHPPPPRMPFVARAPMMQNPRRASSVPPPPASRSAWTPTPDLAATQPLPGAAPKTPTPSLAPALVSTGDIDGHAIEAARNQPVLPFVQGPSTLPPPSQPLPRADDKETADLDPNAVAEALSRPVIPFGRPPTPTPIPTPAPVPVPAPQEAPPKGVAPFEIPPLSIEEAPAQIEEKKKAPAPPAPSEVTPEGARLFNRTPLSMAVFPWASSPSRDCFTVAVRATATIVPGDRATLKERSEKLTDEIVLEEAGRRIVVYPSDLVPFKTRADVVVVGHAYAPGGEATEMDVELRFGGEDSSIDRKIHVYGDRQWHKGARGFEATEPAPFQRMPIRWERAFGGPSFAQNPAGMGFVERGPGASGPSMLANLEDPEAKVRLPSQKPAPSCFAPMPLAWSSRQTPSVKSAPWPFFPEDFDWTHYQAAPPQQRLAFLRGDEPFALVGMHPTAEKLEGRLPGIFPRCFVLREEGGSLEELPLQLDTVVITPEESKLDLVWRGWLPVAEEKRLGSVAIYLVNEPLGGEKKSLEDMRQMLLANP